MSDQAKSDYKKPLPTITDANRPYWEGLKQRKVLFQACRACGEKRVYAFRFCPHCASEETEWVELSGKGEIWALGAFHQVYFEGFREEIPYSVVAVQLDGGPKVYSNIVGTPREKIAIGSRVEPVFEDVTPDVTLLKFRIVEQ